jgi:hypothetical protein
MMPAPETASALRVTWVLLRRLLDQSRRPPVTVVTGGKLLLADWARRLNAGEAESPGAGRHFPAASCS